MCREEEADHRSVVGRVQLTGRLKDKSVVLGPHDPFLTLKNR